MQPKHWLDPLLALNTSGIHELMGIFPQQLSGRPEIELQPKVDLRVGGERAVAARETLVYPARILQKKEAVQVPGLRLKMRGLVGPANQDPG